MFEQFRQPELLYNLQCWVPAALLQEHLLSFFTFNDIMLWCGVQALSIPPLRRNQLTLIHQPQNYSASRSTIKHQENYTFTLQWWGLVPHFEIDFGSWLAISNHSIISWMINAGALSEKWRYGGTRPVPRSRLYPTPHIVKRESESKQDL